MNDVTPADTTRPVHFQIQAEYYMSVILIIRT